MSRARDAAGAPHGGSCDARLLALRGQDCPHLAQPQGRRRLGRSLAGDVLVVLAELVEGAALCRRLERLRSERRRVERAVLGGEQLQLRVVERPVAQQVLALAEVQLDGHRLAVGAAAPHAARVPLVVIELDLDGAADGRVRRGQGLDAGGGVLLAAAHRVHGGVGRRRGLGRPALALLLLLLLRRRRRRCLRLLRLGGAEQRRELLHAGGGGERRAGGDAERRALDRRVGAHGLEGGRASDVRAPLKCLTDRSGAKKCFRQEEA